MPEPTTPAPPHACPSCGAETTYQAFSGGREWYCPGCDENGSYEDGHAPRRVAMLRSPEGVAALREEMREHFATTPAPPATQEASTCTCDSSRAGLNACAACPTPWPDIPGASRTTRPEDVAAGIAAAFAGPAPDLGPDELTAEEARALADELGRDLYEAQNALSFVAECCDVADRTGLTEVPIASVRTWLEGAKCGRQIMAARSDVGTEFVQRADIPNWGALDQVGHDTPEGDADATEADIDRMMVAGIPVQIATGPSPTTGGGVVQLACDLGYDHGDPCAECRDAPAPDAGRDGLRDAIATAIDECRNLTPVALADAVLAVRDSEMERLRAEAQRWLDFIERGFTTHMSFGVINPDGTTGQLPCADWCYACRLETAEAKVADALALHQPRSVVAAAEHGEPADCATCGPNTWPCATFTALTAPGQPAGHDGGGQ